MEFYEVLKNRRSIRAYKNDPVPEEVIDKFVSALQEAPSACNLQPWSFRLIFNEKIKESICSCYKADWLKDAPAIIVALGNSDEAWKRNDGTPATDIDMGIAMEHIVLAATAEGLATCWICAYDVHDMNKALNILPPWDVLAISPLGYAAEKPEKRKRKDDSDIFKIIK